MLTLGTSFPIIAVTLCNNLRSLFDLIFPHQRNSNNNTYRMVSIDSDNHRRTDKCIKFFTVSFNSIGVPLLTIIPPTIIAFSSSNLEKLVALTGSYAGAGIQYLRVDIMKNRPWNKYLCTWKTYPKIFFRMTRAKIRAKHGPSIFGQIFVHTYYYTCANLK